MLSKVSKKPENFGMRVRYILKVNTVFNILHQKNPDFQQTLNGEKDLGVKECYLILKSDNNQFWVIITYS